MPAYTYYYGKSLAYHLQQIASLTKKGYRPISLSINVDGSKEEIIYDYNAPKTFSAIWVQRPGPPFSILPIGTQGELNQFLKKHKERNRRNPYWPRLIAACGTSYARYSVMVEQGGPESYVETDVYGVALESQYAVPSRLDIAREAGEYPMSVASYGIGIKGIADKLYRCAFVWCKQPADKWFYFNGFRVSEADVAVVDAALLSGFARADYIGAYCEQELIENPTTYGRSYYVMYRDDMIPGMATESNIPANNVKQIVDDQELLQKWPIRIQGFTAPGQSERFTIVFADYPHDSEPPRQLTIERPVYPANAGPTPWSEFAPLEQAFIDSLQRDSVHAGQIAVAYRGKLVYTAAFRWAPSGYPSVKPFTRFRLGSMSKPITALAVCRLWDQDLVLPDSTAHDQSIATLLKRTFKDDRFKTRNCSHLMAHLGRFDEPTLLTVGNEFAVQEDLGSFPVLMGDWVDWVALNMDSCFTDDEAPTPGDSPLPVGHYDGVGFTMLAQICAEIYTAQGRYADFEAGVLGDLFGRVRVRRPRKTINQIKKALSAAETSTEVLHHNAIPGFGKSQQFDNAFDITPSAYDPTNSDLFLGNGAWALSCGDYARLLAAFDENPNPLFDNPLMPQLVLTEQAEGKYRGFFRMSFPDATGTPQDAMWHNGALLGGTSVGFRRFDGVTIVYAYNTNLYKNQPRLLEYDANARVNEVATWPSFDLFPAFLQAP